jgi:hypothetical protein
VNWSEEGTTKGLVPVAHSHPIERRELEGGYALDELMKPGGDDSLATARQIVLPSIDDVKVANKLKSKQTTHTVYTPYRVRKVKGQWMVSSGTRKGEPLTFTISGMQSFIVKDGTDRYLSANLTAIAGKKDLMTVETWSENFGKTDRAVGFSQPKPTLEPWG